MCCRYKLTWMILLWLGMHRTRSGYRRSLNATMMSGLLGLLSTLTPVIAVSLIALFFCLMAAWLNEVVVRAVALLSALTKEYNMHIIQC